MMDVDLEDRLRAFSVPTAPFASGNVAARVAKRRRRRRLLASSVSAVMAFAAVAAVLSVTGGDDRTTIVPADVAATDTQEAETSTDATPSSTTVSTVEAANLDVDLTGTDGGLYIDPSALPEGMLLTSATRFDGTDGSLGSSSAQFQEWSTTFAKYSEDRSTIVEHIGVDTLLLPPDRTPVSLIGEAGATSVEVRGLTVWVNGPSAAWAEGPWTMSVSGDAVPADLMKVIEDVEVADDGTVTVTTLPDGYEKVGTLPNPLTDLGPRWTTGYVTAEATSFDRPVLELVITAQAAEPAEYLLVNTLSGDRKFATTVLGRRAILTSSSRYGARHDITITWDEADGAQIQLTYSPMRRDIAEGQLIEQALAFAEGVRRADANGWQDLGDRAAAAMEQLAGDPVRPEWVQSLLGDRDLTITDVRYAEFAEPTVLIVDVQDDNGVAAGTCEVFLRQITTCTPPDDPMISQTGQANVQMIDGGYMRVEVTGDTRYVRLGDSLGGLGRRVEDLFETSKASNPNSSPRVAYVRAPAPDVIACLELRDETDTAMLAAFDLRGETLTPRATGCEDG